MIHILRKVKIKMSLSINPLQPFVLRGQEDISAICLKSLTQLYQPIVGPASISLYLTLMSQPNVVNDDSRRSLRHQILLLQLNIGINELNEARTKLEAVGLVRTYRDMESNPNPQHQTILYDLKLPLLNRAFFQDALLSTALLNQLGEKDYEDLATKLTVAPIDDNRYAEETVTFQKALYPIRVEETAKKVLDEEQEKANNYSPGLDYSRFISYVISEGINHSEITEQLKDQIYAIHDIYGNSESELANLVFLAMDKANGNVNLTDLQKIAQRQNAKANSTWQTEAQQDDIYEIRSEANRTSQMYTKEDIEMRKKQLKDQYPELIPGDMQLIISCEQMPSNAFLNKMKQAKKSFATDSEHFYIKELAQKTRLNEHVVNFLIYYLLVILDRPNIYKGQLERTASEWQQEELTNIPKAMQYVKAQRKKKEIEQKQQDNRANYRKRGQSQHQEIIPSWMKEKEQPTQQQQATPQPTSQYSEDEMRKRLNELIGEEGES